MASKIISFRLPEELLPKLFEQCQQGESVNDAARRIVIDALGGQMPLPPVANLNELISSAITQHLQGVNSRLQVVETRLGE
jgi:hypothetical protein